MADIVLALKPKWLELILIGKKTIECRRSMPKKLKIGDRVYLYCHGCIHGFCTAYDIHHIQRGDFGELMALTDVFHDNACLELDEMGEYLWGGTSPGLIFIKDATRYDDPHPWRGATPQNFIYYRKEEE